MDPLTIGGPDASSRLHQQQPVRSDGLLHDGPGLDVVVALGDVDHPDVVSLALLPLLRVDAVLENHFVRLPVHLGLELLAVRLRHLDVRRGVHSSAPLAALDQGGGGSIQEAGLIGRAPFMGQDDAQGAVHVVSVVGDGPGVLPRPQPDVAVIILLGDLQGDPVPPAGADVRLVTTQVLGVAVLQLDRDVNRVRTGHTQRKHNANMLHANGSASTLRPETRVLNSGSVGVTYSSAEEPSGFSEPTHLTLLFLKRSLTQNDDQYSGFFIFFFICPLSVLSLLFPPSFFFYPCYSSSPLCPSSSSFLSFLFLLPCSSSSTPSSRLFLLLCPHLLLPSSTPSAPFLLLFLSFLPLLLPLLLSSSLPVPAPRTHLLLTVI